jgi:hypothetical protein
MPVELCAGSSEVDEGLRPQCRPKWTIGAAPMRPVNHRNDTKWRASLFLGAVSTSVVALACRLDLPCGRGAGPRHLLL